MQLFTIAISESRDVWGVRKGAYYSRELIGNGVMMVHHFPSHR